MQFWTFLRLQLRWWLLCICKKWCHFSYFSKTFQTKKEFKELRLKMTKIASKGSCFNFGAKNKKKSLLYRSVSAAANVNKCGKFGWDILMSYRPNFGGRRCLFRLFCVSKVITTAHVLEGGVIFYHFTSYYHFIHLKGHKTWSNVEWIVLKLCGPMGNAHDWSD